MNRSKNVISSHRNQSFTTKFIGVQILRFDGEKLELARELSKLDEFVLDFVEILEELDLEYVIVSGYVAILTGRSRGTEDVDVIIEELDEKMTREFAEKVKDEGYWCINSEISNIYGMLKDDLAVRFAEKDKVIPNFEVRFALDKFERSAVENKVRVDLEQKILYISPIELQIAYKLFLGSEKDFEDALHLYKLFAEELNEDDLKKYSKQLEVEDNLDELEGT